MAGKKKAHRPNLGMGAQPRYGQCFEPNQTTQRVATGKDPGKLRSDTCQATQKSPEFSIQDFKIIRSFEHSFLKSFRVINSVGLECYLDRVEVTGSNPV